MDHPVTIHTARSPGEVRIAVTRRNRLTDFAIWRPGAPDGVGDLHRGRVIARVPAMAGAFIALADAEGFLPDSEGQPNLTEGHFLGVRITRAAQAGKGPRLTARLTGEDDALTAEGPVRLIHRGPTPLDDFGARCPGASVTDGFPPEIADQVEALASPEFALTTGGRIHIHPTPALTAIDLDAGSATADRQSKSASQGTFNRAALPELAGQLRLRNLSGAILVDFAGLSPKRRTALEPELRAALANDPVRPRLLGFTRLGLAEIVRPRIRPPLHELLAGPLASGLTALRQAATELAATPYRRAVLTASPAIVTALQADPVALPELAHHSTYPIILRSDPALSGWNLEYRDA